MDPNGLSLFQGVSVQLNNNLEDIEDLEDRERRVEEVSLFSSIGNNLLKCVFFRLKKD